MSFPRRCMFCLHPLANAKAQFGHQRDCPAGAVGILLPLRPGQRYHPTFFAMRSCAIYECLECGRLQVHDKPCEACGGDTKSRGPRDPHRIQVYVPMDEKGRRKQREARARYFAAAKDAPEPPPAPDDLS